MRVKSSESEIVGGLSGQSQGLRVGIGVEKDGKGVQLRSPGSEYVQGMDKWMDGWVNRWMGGWMDGWMIGCHLDVVGLGRSQ